MEIASYLIGKASSITVIGSTELPYQNTLGPEIGRATMMVRTEDWGINSCESVAVLHLFSSLETDDAASADAVGEERQILHER